MGILQGQRASGASLRCILTVRGQTDVLPYSIVTQQLLLNTDIITKESNDDVQLQTIENTKHNKIYTCTKNASQFNSIRSLEH